MLPHKILEHSNQPINQVSCSFKFPQNIILHHCLLPVNHHLHTPYMGVHERVVSKATSFYVVSNSIIPVTMCYGTFTPITSTPIMRTLKLKRNPWINEWMLKAIQTIFITEKHIGCLVAINKYQLPAPTSSAYDT